MKDLEKLINEIMKEAEADGEPITREEAKEMAEIEIKADKMRRYEKSEKIRKKAERTRKVDEDKKYLLTRIEGFIYNIDCNNITMKNEVELSFEYNNNNYTLKLVKHRPPKQ